MVILSGPIGHLGVNLAGPVGTVSKTKNQDTTRNFRHALKIPDQQKEKKKRD